MVESIEVFSDLFLEKVTSLERIYDIEEGEMTITFYNDREKKTEEFTRSLNGFLSIIDSLEEAFSSFREVMEHDFPELKDRELQELASRFSPFSGDFSEFLLKYREEVQKRGMICFIKRLTVHQSGTNQGTLTLSGLKFNLVRHLESIDHLLELVLRDHLSEQQEADWR